jgi:chromosome segregation ATPase
MAEVPQDALLTEIRGLRVDLRESTDRLVNELGARIEANTRRLDSIDVRLESIDGRLHVVEDRLESIDGRLHIVEDSMGWFRQQVLTASRQVSEYALGRSRLEAAVEHLRLRVDALEAGRSEPDAR